MASRPHTAQIVLVVLLLGLLTSLATGPGGQMADHDCGDFDTQTAAQRFFLDHDPAADPHQLDSDGDGIVCESLR